MFKSPSTPTSPPGTVVKVHRDGNIDITQNQNNSPARSTSASTSPSITRPRVRVLGIASPASTAIDDDEIAFEQSLQRLRQLAANSPPPRYSAAVHRSTPTPSPPRRSTSAELDQKHQHHQYHYDIELRAAQAREQALQQQILTQSIHEQQQASTNQLEKEQLQQLQQASSDRVQRQAVRMLQKRAHQSNQAQIIQFESSLRERSLENVKFARAKLEMEKEQAFRNAAEKSEEDLQVQLQQTVNHVTHLHTKRIQSLNMAMVEKKKLEETNIKNLLRLKYSSEEKELQERLHAQLLNELSAAEGKMRDQWSDKHRRLISELQQTTEITLQSRLNDVRTEEEKKYETRIQQCRVQFEKESMITVDELRARVHGEYQIKVDALRTTLFQSIDRQRKKQMTALEQEAEYTFNENKIRFEQEMQESLNNELETYRNDSELLVAKKLRTLKEQLNQDRAQHLEHSSARIKEITDRTGG